MFNYCCAHRDKEEGPTVDTTGDTMAVKHEAVVDLEAMEVEDPVVSSDDDIEMVDVTVKSAQRNGSVACL